MIVNRLGRQERINKTEKELLARQEEPRENGVPEAKLRTHFMKRRTSNAETLSKMEKMGV